MKIDAYHGSYSKPFSRFERKFCGSGVVSRNGWGGRERYAFFFTTSRANAAFFADAGGFIGKYVITPEHPIDLFAPELSLRQSDWAVLPDHITDAYRGDILNGTPFDRLNSLIEFTYLVNSTVDDPFDAIVCEGICDGSVDSTVIAVLNDDEDRANRIIHLVSQEAY